MKKYTNAQLREIQSTEPERAFYLRHEDEFLKLGIDLSLDNWSDALQTELVPSPNENRYIFLQRSLSEASGITVLDADGKLRKIHVDVTNPDVIQSVVLEDNEEVEFQFNERKPRRPADLGAGYRFLHAITFGLYKPNVYRQYVQDMQTYETSITEYNTRKTNAERNFMERNRARTLALSSYEECLEKRGKTPEMQNAYRDACKKHKSQAMSETNVVQSQRNNYNNTSGYVTESAERLDFLFGPKLGAAKEAEMQEKCVTANIFSASAFKDPEDDNAGPKITQLEYPKDCAFSAHEIALLGYAATCNREVNLKAYVQPDPNKAPVYDDADNDVAISRDAMWYNFIDGIVTRKPRKASGANSLINYANADAKKAIDEYAAGKPDALGKIINDGLTRSVGMIIMQNSLTDDHSLSDYGRFCEGLLGIMNKDEALREATVRAGLTEEKLREVKLAINISKTYDAGYKAIGVLANDEDLTPEQRTSAVADVAGLRLTQQLLAKRYQELSSNEKYNNMSATLAGELAKAAQDYRIALENHNHNTKDPVCVKLKRDELVKSGKYSSLSLGYLMPERGFDNSPNAALWGMFEGDNRPEEIHNIFANSDDIKRLGNGASDIALFELKKNAGQYINKVMSKAEQPAREVAPQKNLNIAAPAMQ